ncbi:MAG: hypothetical protein LBH18_01630, partial [Spirochaetaceae bacterium]|nr:hypothetical protein [Spirochaetaceae bacterium]
MPSDDSVTVEADFEEIQYNEININIKPGIKNDIGGSVIAYPLKVPKDSKEAEVNLYVYPKEGYDLKSLKISKVSDENDVIEYIDTTTAQGYSFTMPDDHVNVEVEFEEIKYNDITIEDSTGGKVIAYPSRVRVD